MWCDARGLSRSKAGARTGSRVPSKHESQSVCVLGTEPACRPAQAANAGASGGQQGHLFKDPGTWGWAEGVDEVETGRPRALIARRRVSTHLHWDNSRSKVPRRGGRAPPRALHRAPPRASAAQHPAFPSPSLAAVVRAGHRLLFPPPPSEQQRGGEDGGLGGRLCRALAFCVSSPSKTAAGARALSALVRPSPAAPAPPRPGKLRP